MPPRSPRPPRPPRPGPRPGPRPYGRRRGFGPYPYPFYYAPVVEYSTPRDAVAAGTCVVEDDPRYLPRCFNGQWRMINGRWCCVEDVKI